MKNEKSEFGVACRSREGFNIADVGNARDIHNETLKAETEARMMRAAVFAKLSIPPVILRIESEAPVCLEKLIHALLTLASADELANAGDKHIHSGNSLAVVILTHIECLNLLGIVRYKHGLSEYLLAEVSFVVFTVQLFE